MSIKAKIRFKFTKNNIISFYFTNYYFPMDFTYQLSEKKGMSRLLVEVNY